MSSGSENSGKTSNQSVFTWTLALVVGQVGCFTLIIIFAALLLGLWLDNTLDTKPIFTVGLLIASIPVTLVAMIVVVRSATNRIARETQERKQISTHEEEVNK